MSRIHLLGLAVVLCVASVGCNTAANNSAEKPEKEQPKSTQLNGESGAGSTQTETVNMDVNAPPVETK